MHLHYVSASLHLSDDVHLFQAVSIESKRATKWIKVCALRSNARARLESRSRSLKAKTYVRKNLQAILGPRKKAKLATAARGDTFFIRVAKRATSLLQLDRFVFRVAGHGLLWRTWKQKNLPAWEAAAESWRYVKQGPGGICSACGEELWRYGL